ncbi:PAS domain-containing protein [Rhizomicrobium electricum]|jgi:hypothetical protein|uniref:PAS domain-containing protein n=1 Tax=Rhizomicrobium electricum TaxID=480070 RepID=A0ABN1F450_9PROT|nr:PAS domain-containing protein [Rhizomicrobium electricum]NIJ49359.1 hypothetical protein [Rhizomicrobium electricum]
MSSSGKAHQCGGSEPQFEIIDFGQLRLQPVLEGFRYWNALRGDRPYPARSEISPRSIAPLLANAIVIRVLSGGEDFEIAIAGDEVVRSYRINILHRRLSEIAVDLPIVCAWWGSVYRRIAQCGQPCAVKFSSGLDSEMKFANAETALLPLGPAGGPVDHIIGFTKRHFVALG